MCGVNIKTPISMARALPIMGTAIFLLLTLFSIHAKGDFATTLDPKLHGFNKAENLTHLHFYLHDIYSGTNPTASAIVRPPSGASPAGFGAVSMIDDPLTEGPDIGSQLVGKAQGFYGQASQQDAGLLMAMNLVLLDEKYNGSYITVLGRNKVFDKVREMPVVGGSGLFRFARGYAQASTYTFNQTSGDAIVDYNVYVMH